MIGTDGAYCRSDISCTKESAEFTITLQTRSGAEHRPFVGLAAALGRAYVAPTPAKPPTRAQRWRRTIARASAH